MSQIIYSAQAQYDLERLFVFLGEKDIESAKRAMKAIDDGFKLLAKNPTMWRVIEHGLREYLIDFGKNGYITLYDYHEELDIVEVLAIKHSLENEYKWL
jgi:plasmid stabilization system protein ParE